MSGARQCAHSSVHRSRWRVLEIQHVHMMAYLSLSHGKEQHFDTSSAQTNFTLSGKKSQVQKPQGCPHQHNLFTLGKSTDSRGHLQRRISGASFWDLA